jgi:hypothetical protein
MMTTRNFKTKLLAVCLFAFSPLAWAASEKPPEGPPWTKDFLEAHRIAFEQGKPIFVYSTKTH